MADIDFKLVKDLRDSTGAGIGLCKEALENSNGDVDKALEYIRKKGAAKAEKRIGRSTTEGVIGVYVHGVDHKTAAMVELNCETDFVGRNESFRELAHDIAMHVAAMNPTYLDRESVPEDVLESEKNIMKDSDDMKGKPEDIVEKILEGKLNKFYQDNCLMEQAFFKDDSMTITDLVNDAVARIGEKVVVSRFFRMNVGE